MQDPANQEAQQPIDTSEVREPETNQAETGELSDVSNEEGERTEAETEANPSTDDELERLRAENAALSKRLHDKDVHIGTQGHKLHLTRDELAAYQKALQEFQAKEPVVMSEEEQIALHDRFMSEGKTDGQATLAVMNKVRDQERARQEHREKVMEGERRLADERQKTVFSVLSEEDHYKALGNNAESLVRKEARELERMVTSGQTDFEEIASYIAFTKAYFRDRKSRSEMLAEMSAEKRQAGKRAADLSIPSSGGKKTETPQKEEFYADEQGNVRSRSGWKTDKVEADRAARKAALQRAGVR